MAETRQALDSARPRILLVDDDPGVLTTLDAVLRDERYDVTPSSDLSSAADATQTHDFDLALTDLRLGSVGDGLALIAEAGKRNPHIAAIILTGYADMNSTIEALRLGVSNYLVAEQRRQQQPTHGRKQERLSRGEHRG